MKPEVTQHNLHDVATQALAIVEHRFSLFRLQQSAANRLATLRDLRAVAMRDVELFGASEKNEFRKKAAALLVCGIDDAIGALIDADSSLRDRLNLSAKKKLESALHSIEIIRNEH